MKRSNMVDQKIKELWAVLATASAAKALLKVGMDDTAAAERLAAVTARWLENAGAAATDRSYSRPRV